MIDERRDGVLSVGEANRYVKMLMDNDSLLSSISIQGEISNLKYHSSGHLYFTLKDPEAEISAVMFRSAAAGLKMRVTDGMRVIAYGRISVYEKSGKCQIYVSAMVDNGIGVLQLEFERLKKMLAEEGLFDEQRKRPIPKFPRCIGIITSPTGAAVRDMINVTGRRWPSTKILLFPSLVQGEQAPNSLCLGLEYLNATNACDVIIIGRGGGSIEDLWAFNDERVVRSVAASSIPVISAVGHETDFTLCDFAADLRAPTPSAAAELATPDADEIKLRLDELIGRAEGIALSVLNIKRGAVSELSKRLELSSPSGRLELERKQLSLVSERLEQTIARTIQKNRERFSVLATELGAINPLAVLGRGYSYSQKDGSVVASIEQISVGDKIDIRFSDGIAEAEILSLKTLK
ncbi:MAG: exodeoxyribonuclease VII large subunit [Clostridia bacterium]|nr:exodeoxyribonuclease VII large subunit [Clostridia bacterium]